jgi:tetratricopeptide (TPR) repeat protein
MTEGIYRAQARRQAKVLGASSHKALWARWKRAVALRRSGRLAEAEAEIRAVSEGLTDLLGADDANTLRARSMHAEVLADLGRFAEAAAAWQPIVAASQTSPGVAHRETLRMRSHRAFALYGAGRPVEAEDELRSVADAMATASGTDATDDTHDTDDTELLVVRGMHCRVLGELGKLAEAQAVAVELLEAFRGRPAADRDGLLNARGFYAETQWRMGRLSEAETECRAVLTGLAAANGHGHRGTEVARVAHARMLLELGRPDEAEAELAVAAAAMSGALPPDHWNTLTARFLRARALADMGRTKEAEAEYDAVLAAQAAMLGDGHSRTLEFRAWRADLLRRLGRPGEARDELSSAVGQLTGIIGADNPTVLRHRGHLAAVMSSPVSSRRRFLLGQDALECFVAGGIVGDAVLPAVPDDEQPGASEDADGVGVVVPACDGVVVEPGGPGAGAAGVAGEVGDGVAELLVAGPPEPDGADLAGLAGGGGDPGQAGQRFGGREAGAAVADLGEQAGGADAAGAGQAGEHVLVGVQRELLADLGGQCLDLLVEGDQHGQQRARDVRLGGAVLARRAARGGGKAGVQHGGVGPAAVAGAGQPGGHALGREPAGAVLGVEAGQERQADRGVKLGEQADGAGEDPLEVLAQLVGDADPVADEVLAGPAGAAQGDGLRLVRDEGAQPGTVRAERVGQDERVEAVVFIAGRAVPAAQVLDLVRADHHHGDPGLQQCIDDRAVRALDRDLADAALGEQAQQGTQARRAVLDHAPVDLPAAGIDDRDSVIIACPVDTAGQPIRRFLRQGGWGKLQNSLLAADPSGEAPLSRCRDAAAASLTDRRSAAHSPVGGRHAPGTTRPRITHDGRQKRQASRAVAWRHLGCISDPSRTTDTRMVHQ